jgi:hypothetical protein
VRRRRRLDRFDRHLPGAERASRAPIARWCLEQSTVA